MDPTEALKQLRALMVEATRGDCEGNLSEIVELFNGLDTWLTKGGFLPSQWTPTTRNGW
jgi:hypothetical protein